MKRDDSLWAVAVAWGKRLAEMNRRSSVATVHIEREIPCSPQQIGVKFLPFDDAQYLALDDLEHILPNLPLDLSQALPIVLLAILLPLLGPIVQSGTQVVGDLRELVGRRGEPNLEQLFGAFERAWRGIGEYGRGGRRCRDGGLMLLFESAEVGHGDVLVFNLFDCQWFSRIEPVASS